MIAAAALAGCVPSVKERTTLKTPAAVADPAAVTFAAGETYVIQPVSLTAKENATTFCRLGNVTRYSVYPSGQLGYYGNCDQDIQIAVGPQSRVKLLNGMTVGVYRVQRAKDGVFGAVIEKYDQNTAVGISGPRPLYRFRPGAVNVLAPDAQSEAIFREAVQAAFPGIAGRMAGMIDGTLVPRCRGVGRNPGRPQSLNCEALAGREAEQFLARRTTNAAVLGRIAGVRPSQPAAAPSAAASAPTGSAAAASAPAAPAAAVAGSPPLHEGASYAAFTPAQIQAYCAQDWRERTGADGRTEYNPCYRREVFR